MITHILQHEIEGTGIEQKITPICSCGWRGVGYSAYNDWQMALVKEQEIKHKNLVAADVLVRGSK